MEITKGGRGKKAPYETTHIRVPDQLKPLVEMMAEGYKERVEADGIQEVTPAYIEGVKAAVNHLQDFLSPSSGVVLPMAQAKTLAADLVRQKKSASDSLAKLLTAIYGVEISKSELRQEHED